MRLLFIWDSDYPWDIRVAKICRSLLEAGVEVHLVCRNKHRRPVEEVYDGINIHRIAFLPKKYGRLNDIFSFPLFFSPVWLARINRVVKCHAIDLIIVRDLPMAPAALIVAGFRNIPAILDMAECYPEMLRLVWKFEPFRAVNFFLRNPFVADFLEKIVTRNIDHVWVMIDESKQRLLSKGVSPENISIVSNTPVSARFNQAQPTFAGALQTNKDKLILVYVGYVNYSRGLDTAIDALSCLLEQKIDVFLLIIGKGTAEVALRKQAEKLGVSSRISFAGWIDNKMIPEYVASADICLVPHHKCSHWDNTIPNKLFDYMAAGKPVVVSDVAPMERIVSHAKCGLIYKSGDARSLAAKIVELCDSGQREALGKNGMKAVQEEYNWDNDATVMLNSIKKVLG